MKIKHAICSTLVLCAVTLAAAGANTGGGKDAPPPTTAAGASNTAQDDALRFEGEKRFHANCGRCHTAPPKFGRRMMATIIRHMRVRATITDDDMRLILHYMSE
ncbi:MAG TPA: cytochrome c [Candidatus Angelobacter sp.]|nr:cytochrome c [Candidatus Angelobacter sp.]